MSAAVAEAASGMITSGAANLIGVSTAYGVNRAMQQNTGAGISDIYPSPVRALQLGTYAQNPFAGFGKTSMRYSGMIGFRSLFTGINPAKPYLYATPGGILSTALQGAAKITTGFMGEGTPAFIRAATQLNKYGVSSVASAKYLKDIPAKKGLQGLHRTARFYAYKYFKEGAGKRFLVLGGQGVAENAKIGLQRWKNTGYAVMKKTDGMKDDIIMGTMKATGTVHKIGSMGRWAIRGANILGTLQLAYGVGKFISNRAVANIVPATQRLMQQMNELRSLDIGEPLNPVFTTQGATTERQRAMAAMHRSKIAPENQVMGNEAAMFH